MKFNSKLFTVLFCGIFSISAHAATLTDCPAGEVDVSTLDELQNIFKVCANADTGKTVIKLVNDIDASGLTLNQIYNFTGIFDGGNHTILLGPSESSSIAPSPLFNALDNNAIVKNLHLQINSFYSSVTHNTQSVFGTVASIQMGNSKISHVSVSTKQAIYSAGQDLGIVGGLVGMQSGTSIIEFSSFDGAIVGGKIVGGLVGTQDTAPIIRQSMARWRNTGGNSDKSGGLVGIQYGIGATIENSYSSGNMSTGAGVAYTISGKLINSYSSVFFDYQYTTGGLAVTAGEAAQCLNSYWNTLRVSGSAVCPNGGLNDAQMRDPQTFKSWDQNIWRIVAGEYPTLK